MKDSIKFAIIQTTTSTSHSLSKLKQNPRIWLRGKLKVTVTKISLWIRRSIVNVCFSSLRVLKLLLFWRHKFGREISPQSILHL